MYRVLITAHGLTATVALIAAVGARRARWFHVYQVSLTAMLVLLVAAVTVDLPGRELGQHLVAGGLVVLGAVMVGHAELARRSRRVDRQRFIDHVGFTVVGLVDAFVIVTLFNTGVPGTVAAIVGVGIAISGHLALVHARKVPLTGARSSARTHTVHLMTGTSGRSSSRVATVRRWLVIDSPGREPRFEWFRRDDVGAVHASAGVEVIQSGGGTRTRDFLLAKPLRRLNIASSQHAELQLFAPVVSCCRLVFPHGGDPHQVTRPRSGSPSRSPTPSTASTPATLNGQVPAGVPPARRRHDSDDPAPSGGRDAPHARQQLCDTGVSFEVHFLRASRTPLAVTATTSGEETTMGALSVLLIAAGAVLTFAVEREVDGFDLRMVGVILMIVGAIGLIASVARGSMLGFRSTRERRVSADGRTVVERERVGGI